MGKFSIFSTFRVLGPAVALAVSLAPRAAHGITQVEAIAQAAAVSRTGSDESLQNSTTSAMRALLDLNEQNQSGAIAHGYKAFGEYRTSQGLDMDRMRNRIRQIDLFTSNLTVNSPVPDWAKSTENYRTTFARLDPAFLHQGEAGKIADEFEKKSGMPRELFLQRMAETSESSISSDDPNLSAKVMNRFRGFLGEIPNEKFRGHVLEQIESVSSSSRTTLITNGAKHIFEVLAAKGIQLSQKVAALMPAPASDSGRAPASVAADEPAVAPVAAASAPARKEDPFQASKPSFVRDMPSTDADFRGLDREKFSGDPLGRIMQTALDEQGDATIFKQVSRRYRAIAPTLNRTKD